MVLGDPYEKVIRPQRGCCPQSLEEGEVCHLQPERDQHVYQVLVRASPGLLSRLVTTDPDLSDGKENLGGPEVFRFPKFFRSLTTSYWRTRGQQQ